MMASKLDGSTEIDYWLNNWLNNNNNSEYWREWFNLLIEVSERSRKREKRVWKLDLGW